MALKKLSKFMKPVQLYNTLTGKKEKLKPIHASEVRMYTCGPTVYDYPHIGNLRAYVFADTVRRVLEYSGYTVRQVMNITDVGHLTSDADEGEDKMVRALRRARKPLTLSAMREVADFYAAAFKKDLEALNIETPAALPHASDHIPEDIELIRRLEEKGFAYKTSAGMYFDTNAFRGYGKLGNINLAGQKAGARVAVHPEKKNAVDFTLWKISENDIGWESPWGKGFPGWHIECSAMSRHYLGQPFDIHTGGIDHIPIHHNNEIAQSEAAYGVPLANVWMHNAYLVVPSDPASPGNSDGADKMAKSEGNVLTLPALHEKGIIPSAYRYYLLMAHYRNPLQWSLEAARAAQQALLRLAHHVTGFGDEAAKPDPSYQKIFQAYIGDDLNTPEALSLAWKLARDETLPPATRRATLLDFDRVLGLNLSALAEEIKRSSEEIPPEVRELIMIREAARKEKNFSRSDALREEIKKLGYDISDTETGVTVRKL